MTLSGATVNTQRYCETGTPGCKEEGKVITCYCSSNNCNEDIKTAGWRKGASSGSGSGGSSEFNNEAKTWNKGTFQFVLTMVGVVLVTSRN